MPIRRILVVDDSPTERHVLLTALSAAGYDVTSLENAQDIVPKIKQLAPDMILMDVIMPGLNGFQATRMITRDPATSHIPVIMCTSKSQDTDKIWGMRQGARDYVCKPVDITTLLTKIQDLG